MHISFSPFASLPGEFESLIVSLVGDVLILNSEAFDLTQLPEGAKLPAEKIASPWFAGPVSRINGELYLTLRLPYVSDGTQFAPEPIHVTEDGPIPLPTDEVPA